MGSNQSKLMSTQALQKYATEEFLSCYTTLQTFFKLASKDQDYIDTNPDKTLDFCQKALKNYMQFHEYIPLIKNLYKKEFDATIPLLASACAIGGKLLIDKRKIDEAKPYFDTSIKLQPNDPKYYNNKLIWIKEKYSTPSILQKTFLISALKNDLAQATKDYIIKRIMELNLLETFEEDDYNILFENLNQNDIINLKTMTECYLNLELYEDAILFGEKALKLIRKNTYQLSYADEDIDKTQLVKEIKNNITKHLATAYKLKFQSNATPESEKQDSIKNAINYSKTLSKENLEEAFFLLAEMHDLNPNATPKDKAEMMDFYQKAVDLNNIHAMVNLACQHMNGTHVEKSIDRAKTLLITAAQQLDQRNNYQDYSNCVNKLYQKLFEIFDCSDTSEEAIQYFENAAKHGIQVANYGMIALLLKMGDNDRLKEHLSKLIKTQSNNAILLTTFAYILISDPHRTETDLDNAIKYLETAAVYGETPAIFNLHQIFIETEGRKIEKNRMQTLIGIAIQKSKDTPDEELLSLQSFYTQQITAENLKNLRGSRVLSKRQTEIRSVYNLYYESNPGKGIQLLLTFFNETLDFHNITTLIDLLSKLFQQNTVETNAFRPAILETLSKLSLMSLYQADKASGGHLQQAGSKILHLVRSLSTFKYSLDTPELQQLTKDIISFIPTEHFNLSKTQTVLTLHYLSSLLPCKNTLVLTKIQAILEALAKEPLLSDNTYSTLLLQTLATLHHNQLFEISSSLIEKTFSNTITAIAPDKMPEQQTRQQAYLGLIYFSNIDLDGNRIYIDKKTLPNLERQIKKDKSNQKPMSQLQKRVLRLCKKSYKNAVISEHPIHTLPVDIFLKELNIAIQVDGPTHFIFNGLEMQYAASECFLDHIIGLNNNTKVVHVHYKEIQACDDNALLALITQRVRDCQSIKILASQADETPTSGKQPAAEDSSMPLQLSRN